MAICLCSATLYGKCWPLRLYCSETVSPRLSTFSIKKTLIKMKINRPTASLVLSRWFKIVRPTKVGCPNRCQTVRRWQLTGSMHLKYCTKNDAVWRPLYTTDCHKCAGRVTFTQYLTFKNMWIFMIKKRRSTQVCAHFCASIFKFDVAKSRPASTFNLHEDWHKNSDSVQKSTVLRVAHSVILCH